MHAPPKQPFGAPLGESWHSKLVQPSKAWLGPPEAPRCRSKLNQSCGGNSTRCGFWTLASDIDARWVIFGRRVRSAASGRCRKRHIWIDCSSLEPRVELCRASEPFELQTKPSQTKPNQVDKWEIAERNTIFVWPERKLFFASLLFLFSLFRSIHQFEPLTAKLKLKYKNNNSNNNVEWREAKLNRLKFITQYFGSLWTANRTLGAKVNWFQYWQRANQPSS